MTKAISIYEAKTNLSKLVKQAAAGKTIYIGSYGQAQAVIAPLPAKPKNTLIVGAWVNNSDILIPDDLDSPDQEVVDLFEDSQIFPDGDD